MILAFSSRRDSRHYDFTHMYILLSAVSFCKSSFQITLVTRVLHYGCIHCVHVRIIPPIIHEYFDCLLKVLKLCIINKSPQFTIIVNVVINYFCNNHDTEI